MWEGRVGICLRFIYLGYDEEREDGVFYKIVGDVGGGE